MRESLTAEQFRLVWTRAGGDAIPMPIQAPRRGRMVSDRDRIGLELDAWWAANEDPELYAAVRALRRSPILLHLEGYPSGGRPLRALLGTGGTGDAVLVMQDAVAAVLDGDGPDWFADAAIDAAGWSLERGGAVRIVVGHTADLVGQLVSAAPEFAAGATPALRGEQALPTGEPGTGYTSRASTTSRSERIAALLARPRSQHGSVYASVEESVGWREVGRFDWIVVEGDGGYVVAGGAASVRPAARSDLAVAARELLASARAAAEVAASVV